MPNWLFDILNLPALKIACAIWNVAMRAVTGVITTTPQEFSSDTWTFVEETLYPWSLSIGLSVLNMFFLIGIWNALKNLHQNITLEMVVETLIQIVVANVIFLNLMKIMTAVFRVASLMTSGLFTMQAPTMAAEDMDVTSRLFYWLFGSFCILASIVCSFLILLTVYGRYIKLYMLVVTAPFAVPTLLGGHEVSRSFYAWLKTFLLNAFEIVAIALAMVLCWKLIGAGTDLFSSDAALLSEFNGCLQALNAMFTMILMTVTVKGVNQFLSRTFAL